MPHHINLDRLLDLNLQGKLLARKKNTKFWSASDHLDHSIKRGMEHKIVNTYVVQPPAGVKGELVEKALSKTTPKKSPRKKAPPRKLEQYVIVNKPSGYCPKCRHYVKHEDKGVECSKCYAFWHYSCAGVTEEQLESHWKNTDFLCVQHRDKPSFSSNKPSSSLKGLVSVDTHNMNTEELKIPVKVNTYTLNKVGGMKKLLRRPPRGLRYYDIGLFF